MARWVKLKHLGDDDNDNGQDDNDGHDDFDDVKDDEVGIDHIGDGVWQLWHSTWFQVWGKAKKNLNLGAKL